ncbi:hypothetical protein TNCV_4458481, partial [Trichonephila clavipes]
YTRAFRDGPRNFEPWLTRTILTWSWPLLTTTPFQQEGRLSSTDLILPYTTVFSGTGSNCDTLVLDESRSFFRVHTGYFSNIPKCIKAEFIASWACSQSSVVSSSQR